VKLFQELALFLQLFLLVVMIVYVMDIGRRFFMPLRSLNFMGQCIHFFLFAGVGSISVVLSQIKSPMY
jgi:hypothetical protein